MSTYESLYKEIKLIGKGSYGTALLIESISTGQRYIAKKIPLDLLTIKEKEAAVQEAEILKSLQHPNIVSYIHSFYEKGTLVIIMEYCNRRDISIYIKMCREQDKHFSEKDIMNWFVQICLGLEHVHKTRILHRDLKSSNIFITEDNCIKIGDFGISKILSSTFDSAMSVVGTPYYMRYTSHDQP